jgi:hypothetical protein
MAKSKKQKTKEKPIMNSADSNSTTPVIPALNEPQKSFESLLAALRLVEGAIAKRDEATEAARKTRLATLVTDLSKPNPQIETLATAACNDLKASEDKAKQVRDSLECVAEYFRKSIELFEKQNCADALAVYRKELAEFLQSDAQKGEIEAKIADLEKLCHEPKPAAK